MEATTSQFYSVTLTLNALALLVATSISDLSIVNGLNGAVCTNLAAFVLPVLFYIKVRQLLPTSYVLLPTSYHSYFLPLLLLTAPCAH